MTWVSLCIGASSGLGAGIYASALWACGKARGALADFLAAMLAIVGFVYFFLPGTPKPGELLRGAGVDVTPLDLAVAIVAFVGVAALTFAVAMKSGQIARIARALDRPDDSE